MKARQIQFSFFERLVVVTIILLVSAMVIQNVLHSVKASEEHTLSNAAVEYAAVKSMYAEQHKTIAPGMARTSASGPVNTYDAPAH